jgi:NADPH:quinone reductase-like Zn-dependent oxidoreductase
MLGSMTALPTRSPNADDQRLAWRIPRAGSLSRLALVQEPLAPPGDGEVQVDVAAVGINFADIFACLGLYSATPSGSFVPGLEAAGTVRKVGPGVTRWRAGDRVIVLTRFGGYATALNLGERYLWPLPDGWSFEEAAAYPVQALTAWYGLVPLGGARRDSVVLVQSAAGGVGLNALQVLRSLGARPVGVVGSTAKRDWLVREQGLDPRCVVLRDAQFGAGLDAALSHLGATGFDLVFDAVYGPWFRPAFDRLAPEGRHLLYGAADFMGAGRRANPLRLAWQWLRRPRLDPLAMISQNRGLLAFNLIWLWGEAARLPDAMKETLALMPGRPQIGGRWPFADAHSALSALQSGRTIGKLILSVDALE